ncbi:hypothetical protein HK101_003372, partial [Irineochytrium annulatum]
DGQISEVKAKIEGLQGFAAAHQKLIHSGKVLGDDVTVESCNIKEKDFLVVMVTKVRIGGHDLRLVLTPQQPKATPSTAAASSTASAPAPAPAPAPQPAAPTPATDSATPPAPAPGPTPMEGNVATDPAATSAPSSFDASTLATGASYNAAVQNMIEMGFPREEVLRAMRAAFNNPDRAAEYLMVGIPEGLEPMGPPAGAGAPRPATAGAAPAPAAPASGGTPAAATPPATAGGGAQPYVNLFDAGVAATQQSRGGGGAGAAAGGAPNAAAMQQVAGLRNSPQFQQIRQLIRSQPQLLQPLLQQLSETNPQLVQAITQNPEMIAQILDDGGEGLSEGAGGAGGAEGGDAGAQYITITPEEDAAINRLAALGFDRQRAAEAFFACDKNEELAANLLFDSMNQDDWQATSRSNNAMISTPQMDRHQRTLTPPPQAAPSLPYLGSLMPLPLPCGDLRYSYPTPSFSSSSLGMPVFDSYPTPLPSYTHSERYVSEYSTLSQIMAIDPPQPIMPELKLAEPVRLTRVGSNLPAATPLPVGMVVRSSAFGVVDPASTLAPTFDSGMFRSPLQMEEKLYDFLAPSPERPFASLMKSEQQMLMNILNQYNGMDFSTPLKSPPMRMTSPVTSEDSRSPDSNPTKRRAIELEGSADSFAASAFSSMAPSKPRSQKAHVETTCTCRTCGVVIATLLLFGTKEALAEPHVVDVRCGTCRPDVLFVTPLEDSSKRKRKRTKRAPGCGEDVGPNSALVCRICTMVIGSGGVRHVHIHLQIPTDTKVRRFVTYAIPVHNAASPSIESINPVLYNGNPFPQSSPMPFSDLPLGTAIDQLATETCQFFRETKLSGIADPAVMTTTRFDTFEKIQAWVDVLTLELSLMIRGLFHPQIPAAEYDRKRLRRYLSLVFVPTAPPTIVKKGPTQEPSFRIAGCMTSTWNVTDQCVYMRFAVGLGHTGLNASSMMPGLISSGVRRVEADVMAHAMMAGITIPRELPPLFIFGATAFPNMPE